MAEFEYGRRKVIFRGTPYINFKFILHKKDGRFRNTENKKIGYNSSAMTSMNVITLAKVLIHMGHGK